MSEISKFEALERKITQAIEKMAVLRDEKKVLEARLAEEVERNASLKKNSEAIKTDSRSAKNPDLDKIRVKVDSLLEKIDSLEL